MPQFIKVTTTDELEDQQAKLVEVEGQKIALFRVGEAFYALSDTCTHRGGPVVRRDGRGNRSDLPLARGEVRHQDRDRPRAAGRTRGQELPGAGHRRRYRDRSVRRLGLLGQARDDSYGPASEGQDCLLPCQGKPAWLTSDGKDRNPKLRPSSPGGREAA